MRRWIRDTRMAYEKESREGGSPRERLRIIYELKNGEDGRMKPKCDNFVCELLNIDAKVLKDLQESMFEFLFLWCNKVVDYFFCMRTQRPTGLALWWEGKGVQHLSSVRGST